MGKKNKAGITVDKLEKPNEWYTEIIAKSNLIEYTDVSGCYILKPKSQFIWDTIHDFMDKLIKERKVKNASFPLFIPESYLLKEQDHVEGFSPEVAWVTKAGDTELNEKLAIRPTSETIMYPAYAKWIRSHNDLPLKLNQWCSVVRWEFKNPMPFLRSREFYWQEGHTAFATKKEADTEAKDILLNVYKKTYEELLAIPCMTGKKSEKEKFAGADYSLSCEVYLPIGKAIQGCTSHHLGQNFAKAFNITFTDTDQKDKYVYQNSWGFTTRSIGVAIMMHSDSHGLVLPPRIAENKLAIVPIQKKGGKDVTSYAKAIAGELGEFNPILDDREQYSPGWKFNEHELNGIPLRIEIGEKEMAEGKLTLMRRDTLEKKSVERKDLAETIKNELDAMHDALFKKAQSFLDDNLIESYDKKEIIKAVKKGKVVKTVYDGTIETEDIIKDQTTGKTLVIPFDAKKPDKACPFSGKPAKHEVYLARSL
ncbi:MAG: proline--tRNA ligase [Nanoarchaeota archaeon]